MSDIVKRRTLTTDIDGYFANTDARMEHGGDHLSTSMTVEVRRLSHPDVLIEVEVMAVIPERRGSVGYGRSSRRHSGALATASEPGIQ